MEGDAMLIVACFELTPTQRFGSQAMLRTISRLEEIGQLEDGAHIGEPMVNLGEGKKQQPSPARIAAVLSTDTYSS